MKKLFTTALFLVTCTLVYSQCTPDPQFVVGGIYPDSATGLSDAYVGQQYNELITIITPEDTVVDAGQITGLPIGIISVDIDSITLNSVTGLPPNFDYYCDPPSCGFIGGTTECAELYSVIDPTINHIGTYQIVFETTAYVSGIPLLGSTTQDDVIDYYYLNIVNSTSVLNYLSKDKFLINNISPNPANDFVNINYLIGHQSNVVCNVYNLVGEKISSFKFSSNKGINNESIVTNTFSEGIYIFSISDGNICINQRVVINR
mgnify:CR=1 FL=1